MQYKILKEDGSALLQENGSYILIDVPDGIEIEVNGIDRSAYIDWQSVKKTEVLTKEADTLEFLIKNYPTKTYLPALGDAIEMFTGDTLIFAGTVIEIDNTVDGLLQYNRIICKDYTHLADQKLVSKNYTSQTVAQIAADIVSTYCPAGFTYNITAPDTIDSIAFNYVSVSAALQKLISAVGGGYDYYFDYYKVLQFFPTGYYIAPFALTDTSANYDWQTLSLNTDLSQLRNRVTVRGGVTTGSSVTNKQIADGTQCVFFVGYSFGSITVSKALAASPTSFSAQTVGADGKDDPTAFNCLYNPNSGLLIYPDGTKPAINDVVKYIGTPSFPVVVQLQDDVSINLYGTYEYLVTDKTIISKAVARNKADEILLQYSRPLTTGSFNTRTNGLKAGQIIAISSAARNISGAYKIQRIETKLRTPSAVTSDLIYNVQIVSTQVLTMNDVLRRLLITDPTDQVAIALNEIIDTVYSESETITVTDVAVVSSNNSQTETITIGEAVTAQAVNYAVIFCLDTPAPSGFKRGFILNGSSLG